MLEISDITRPLHGIPILVKDNIATNDKMNNTAGCLCLLGAKVSRDSTVVAKLRAAGAILLGKANLSEWAQRRSNNTTDGWSAYGGQTTGAYYPNQNPRGSSSGSGVAVSIGLAAAALGTETEGSIIAPSEINNLVGIKPTVGLTSRDLVITISLRQDSVGPMARTVKDAAYILSAIAGRDLKYDNFTSAQPFAVPPDYMKALNSSGLQGARIGIPRNDNIFYELLHGGKRSAKNGKMILVAFENAVKVLESAGATIVDNTNMTFLGNSFEKYISKLSESRDILLDIDLLTSLEKYFSGLQVNPVGIHTMGDLIQYTKSEPREEYSKRNIVSFEHAIFLNLTASSSEVWEAYQAGLQLADEGGIIRAMNVYRLDAIIMPSSGSFFLPALLGTPVITVPMGGFSEDADVGKRQRDLVDEGPNIPFGLSFLGRKWSEERLISYAYSFEQRTNIRKQIKPYFLPKAELRRHGTQGSGYGNLQAQKTLAVR
ncbi:MAG: hypothetical protein Q9187_004194 [Circinaria calcarea]